MSSKRRVDEAKKVAVAYGKVFNSEDGEIVLLDLMRVTGIMDSPFDENSNTMAFNSGRQSIVYSILKAAKIDLQKYFKMVEDSITAQQGD